GSWQKQEYWSTQIRRTNLLMRSVGGSCILSRLSLGMLFLALRLLGRGPGRHDRVHPRIGNRLPEVFMHMKGSVEIETTHGRFLAEHFRRLFEVCVRGVEERGADKIKRGFELFLDLCLLSDGLLHIFGKVLGLFYTSHRGKQIVRACNVHEDFTDRPHAF